MALTKQHGLLARLLDYVVEQGKEIDPRAYVLTGASDFRRFAKDLAGLPGVELDRKIEGDHIWLQVLRLDAKPAPKLPDDALLPFVTVTDDPAGPAPAANEVALKHRAATDSRTLGEQAATQHDVDRRSQVTAALAQYASLWRAWAEGERPRRRTISLYGDLFLLKGRLEAEESSTPSELVWGLGVSAWKFGGVLTENGNGQAVSVDYQYPVLTQVVEIELDSQTHTISVRPRAVAPRLEFDAFGACQVMGAAEVEKQAKTLLEREAEHPLTPFDIASFEPILKLVAGNLDKQGRYDPEHQGLPAPSDSLLVTSGWVLFVRERPSNYLVDDIRRLRDRLLAGDEIPAGPQCLVTPPADEVIRYDGISFRGLCGGGWRDGDAELRELYFPLPYNQEQETIVEMLERAPGVSVQGPPGTGKTHTIANIVCHYLATGRKVLVTSKGEHALEVLQSKIPEEVRPLTVALMSGDKEGMRQFQASIEAIIHNLSQLNPRATQGEIDRCKQQIDAGHIELASIDRRVDEIAVQQLSGIEVDGVALRAQKMAELVIDGQSAHGWFDDELTLAAEHAPPLTAQEAQALRAARRKLGYDLIYARARLPSSASLLPTESIGKLHEALVGMREIDDAESAGQLRALRAATPEVLEQARELLNAIERSIDIVGQLEELESPWVFELRHKCRRTDFASEQEALKALFSEIDGLVLARAAFMQQPVAIPVNALNDAKVLQAVERACESGKPFGVFAFGNSEAKESVAAIKVSGLAPASVEQWKHVRRYFELQERALSFSVRWNQFAQALSVPTIDGSVEGLRMTEKVALAAKKAHELATLHDARLPRLADGVFRDPPKTELGGGSAELRSVRDQLRFHLTRAELAAAAAQLAILQEKLAGTSGPVVDALRAFIDAQLGVPELATERAVAQYAELVGELKRIETLELPLSTVNEFCCRIEQAGAAKLAGRLRTRALQASGEDEILPVAWRDAWNWARIRHHLDAIEAREEMLGLASRRRSLEKVLAQQYERMVARSAWLEAKSQASAKVLSALESYRVAIRKIGQGTGPNATRYRRDAQKAMLDAQGAIPCWIMSHAKVSESMPADLGAFDLVIVDEASQSNLWALPAVLRGKKILVVGDDKQVSPSGSFVSGAKILALRERFLSDQPYGQDLTPEKSLYDIASTVFAAQRVMLAEHFRSVLPIIAYSNRTFYKNQIRPLRVPKASERIDPPLVDVLITDGLRDKKDINRQEAEFIVAEIEEIVRNPKLRDRTIGVVSLLGPDQAKYVRTLAMARLDVAELERRKFECGDAYVFQGSERDIMFLTMVADSQNHHALSGQAFEQRFNVAASRARDRMYLVRSVKLGELSSADIRRTLVEHFSQPIETLGESSDLIELCESGFERDVYASLCHLGYRVTPQVKAGAYRIDMVVEGANDIRLAIECDGDEFHGLDRWPADMQRQRILERAGWVFWRCFASTWSLAKDEVLAELRARLHAMGIEPLGLQERTPSLVEYRQWPPAPVSTPEALAAE
ncbi:MULTISPECIES: AAA domain-containing protein [Lysobacter]|uniref:AAA domain-containing protein n=1 Tax=Lysobacter TaxID=68 RepID=UPI001F228FF2|nr:MULTISPECIES: AAA domain-containing protein [Lysobacter]UJB19943.1 AAA domain-containing protein [Lysobacter capsici]UJQ26331.1 AAA domain-containing protein [Lysobacter gummosus]